MIFVGHDWAQDHHDICVEDADGVVLEACRFNQDVSGLAAFHELISLHVEESSDVVVGTETDHGFFVDSMVSAGYEVHAVNPLSASHYRNLHSVSGSKSDKADAKMLADMVRIDRANLRVVSSDSEESKAIGIVARSHQSLIWGRSRQSNVLRSTLEEFYPAALNAFGKDLDHGDCVEVLAIAPTPSLGKKLSLSQIESALRRGGRQRYVTSRAKEIQQLLRADELDAPPIIEKAFGSTVKASARILSEMNRQIKEVEKELASHFEQHPDAEIYLSLPGLGDVLGARVLGELGDDPSRYDSAKSRKNSAGTSPITKASGKSSVVIRRQAKNNHIVDACHGWAFSSLNASPGARAYYDQLRGRGKSHHRALRALANRWVGILHGCLKTRSLYSEEIAWPSQAQAA